jgi:hypothetical protein
MGNAMKVEMSTKNLVEALKTYQEYNRLKNDRDAYLYNLGAWALETGEVEGKPDKKDFGIE